ALIDILDKTSPVFSISYVWGYSFLVNYAIFLWRFFFWLTSLKLLRKPIRKIATLFNRMNSKEFMHFLCRENPHAIISTHFLPSEVAAALKFNRKIDSKVITVVTDFAVHPFWVSPGIDKYVVATEYTKHKLINEGVSEKAIEVLGIPVHPKFLVRYEKSSLCVKLNIERNKFTILIVTGSFGIGPIEEIVELLRNQAQILVVCAKNRALYNKLKVKNYAGVYVYGFIDNIEELMAVSDIIITKPGGSSIAEILNMELVPIFIHPIPGQETENIKAMSYYGIGSYARGLRDIAEAVDYYKNNPSGISAVKCKIRELKNAFRPQGVCDVIR
ncbi:MAG: hypothetical protein NC914_03505, partial [Candidatus Omnitrophica bacterium]|nr:hypothetical protein [Candidatus Omnitrophota bacterium]